MLGFVFTLAASCSAAAAAAMPNILNVSGVLSGFESEKRKNMFKLRGWRVEERRCDALMSSRKFDGSCMQRPTDAELLPLLVTGTPSVGSRALADFMQAMMPGEAAHEEYAFKATVSWTHAANDFLFGIPYPYSSDRGLWWRQRAISNRVDFENVFKPRFVKVLHLVRCPIRVLAALARSRAPMLRFVEKVTRNPAITSPCADAYHCAAGWRERVGWAVSFYVAWNEHVGRFADERLQIEAFDVSEEATRALGRRLCTQAFALKNRKPNQCEERVANAMAHSALGQRHAQSTPTSRPMLTAADLGRALWPPGVDGAETLRRYETLARAYGYTEECVTGDSAGDTAQQQPLQWDVDARALTRVPQAVKRFDATRGTKAGIERCLAGEDGACSLFDECPAEPPPRDCLRAAVLFRTPYPPAPADDSFRNPLRFR